MSHLLAGHPVPAAVHVQTTAPALHRTAPRGAGGQPLVLADSGSADEGRGF